jgi:DNA ligase-1
VVASVVVAPAARMEMGTGMNAVPKVMLAADLAKVDNNFDHVQYPVLASPKLDGVRCLIWRGVAYSRNAKPLRNKFVQNWARKHHNLDGELIVGSPTEGEVLGRSMAVTAIEGEPDFRFHLFDTLNAQQFLERVKYIQSEHDGAHRVVKVPHHHVGHQEQLRHHELTWLQKGYEGVMLRDPLGVYKHGRSTLLEGGLIKVKRFMDGEATVTELEEAETNTNEAFEDELGRTKRSSAKAGMVGNGMVGTILAHSKEWGALRVAPGKMSHFDRKVWWEARTAAGKHIMIGKTIHWRSFGYGIKDKPRFPRFYAIIEGACA